MLSYVGANVLEDACVRLPVARQVVDGNGLVADHDLRARIAHALHVVAHQIGPGTQQPG